MVNAGIFLVVLLVALYFNILTTCVLMGISHIITTADTVFIVLIALYILLYIFRRREAKKDMKVRIDEHK